MRDVTDAALFYLAGGLGLGATILYAWRTGLVWHLVHRAERFSRLAICLVLLSVVNGLLDQARNGEPFRARHVLVLLALALLLAAKVYMFPLVWDLFRSRRNASHRKEGRA